MTASVGWSPKNQPHQPEPSFSSHERMPSRLNTKLRTVIPTTSIERKTNESIEPFLTSLATETSPNSILPAFLHSPQLFINTTKAAGKNYDQSGDHTPLIKQAGSPLSLPIRSRSNAQFKPMSMTTSPDLSMVTRSSKFEANLKLKGRLGESRMEQNRDKVYKKESKKLEKKRTGTISPRTIGTHFNYQEQHLTFIPENISSTSAMNKTSFQRFDDLARTTNSMHQSILGNIIMEDMLNRTQEENRSENKRIDILKKTLEFNRLQKTMYDSEIDRKQKEIVLPLVKQEQERITKEKQMRTLKVTSNQVAQTKAHGWDSMILNSTVFDSVNRSASQSDLKAQKDIKRKGQKNDPRLSEMTDLTNAIKASFKFKFFWHTIDEKHMTWIPHAREGHTLTTVGNQIILYGGFGNSTKSDIAIYSPVNRIWKNPEIKGDAPLNGRQGHTTCEYQGAAIIFGGEERLEPDMKYREFLHDTRAFYPETGEWKLLPCIGKTISPRRNHTAAIIDKYMYVYGGVTSEGVYQNDIWKLSLKSYVWAQLSVEGTRQGGIAFHSMCACLSERRNNPQKIRSGSKLFEEGLYMFGGKDEEGRVLSTLKFLDPTSKTLQWRYPTTKGIPPCERFNHTMIFYQPLALLVVYGGKNISLRDPEKIRDLTDIKILSLETMSWNSTTSYGDVPKIYRSNHAATVLGNTMLIFGGLGEREYMPTQMKIVELSQANAQKLIAEQDQKDKDASINRGSEMLPTYSDLSPVNLKKNEFGMRRDYREDTLTFLLPLQTEQNRVNLRLNPRLAKEVSDKDRLREDWKKIHNSIM